MKWYQSSRVISIAFALIAIFFIGCSSLVQVISPNPTDPTATTNGYNMDAAGHYIIKIVFNNAINPSTVVIKQTLKLHFSKDPNADATIAWSPDSKIATVTTVLTRDMLNIFRPDDHFTLTLVGTNEGNGVVKSAGGDVLDGDYSNSGGGNYVMGFTIIG